jgi:putative addiction module component (TIGR02574 family)
MTTDEIARLSPRERLDLIAELWDSLSPEDVTLTPAQEAKIHRRLRTFDDDVKTTKTWDSFESELTRKLRSKAQALITEAAQADIEDALRRPFPLTIPHSSLQLRPRSLTKHRFSARQCAPARASNA